MDTTCIDKLLTKLCGNQFLGVFPWTQLPTDELVKPCLFVANTDCHHLPGVHWVAIYIGRDGVGEYLDSYGRVPDLHFQQFMNLHCSRWTYNVKQLQHVASELCGHYCIFFCAYRSVGFSMTTIMSWFTRNTRANDALVYKFVCRRIIM